MAEELHNLHNTSISTPVPDPTTLTTAALAREILNLKEVVFTRLEGMDRAIVIFNENITRVPTDTDKQIQHLKELHEEKFTSIQKQFDERDTRTEQTSRDSKVAVDAALQAAKEAVGEQNKSSALAIAKSENATTKQIDQQALLITSATTSLNDKIDSLNTGLNDKIDDVKQRTQVIESESRGSKSTHDDSRVLLTSMISGIISVVSIMIAIIALFLKYR